MRGLGLVRAGCWPAPSAAALHFPSCEGAGQQAGPPCCSPQGVSQPQCPKACFSLLLTQGS